MIRALSLLTAFFLFPALSFGQSADGATPQSPAPDPQPPVVLELFTSQGCAFCPPADNLLGQIAGEEGVIALSCHVDYFDVKDNSLGQSFCTARQNDYNRLIGTGPRYTPQLVVNGYMDMIGYEGGKVSAAILKARSEKIGRIGIRPADDGFILSLPQTETKNAPVRLWLAVYDRPHEIKIMQGGNAGKTIVYKNVVSAFSDLGAWDGVAAEKNIASGLTTQNAGFAIVAQNTTTGKIIAAGSLTQP